MFGNFHRLGKTLTKFQPTLQVQINSGGNKLSMQCPPVWWALDTYTQNVQNVARKTLPYKLLCLYHFVFWWTTILTVCISICMQWCPRETIWCLLAECQEEERVNDSDVSKRRWFSHQLDSVCEASSAGPHNCKVTFHWTPSHPIWKQDLLCYLKVRHRLTDAPLRCA